MNAFLAMLISQWELRRACLSFHGLSFKYNVYYRSELSPRIAVGYLDKNYEFFPGNFGAIKADESQ